MRPESPPANRCDRAAGFTLIEAVMVIAIMGVVAAMVAVFIRAPVQGYFDASRRAALTDVADTAVRRIGRDLHLALPNSVRNDAGPTCIEFLPTVTGGRYRAEQNCSAGACTGDMLEFDANDTGFDVLGDMNFIPGANDKVVVYNLGIPGADAYAGDNTANISAASATNISFAAKRFPFSSPGSRFHIIPNSDRVASYVCSGAGVDAAGNGTGVLYRYANYTPDIPAPTVCPVPPAGTPVLAHNVSACDFTYAAGVLARSGLISMQLSLTKDHETVTLYQEVHVNNVP